MSARSLTCMRNCSPLALAAPRSCSSPKISRSSLRSPIASPSCFTAASRKRAAIGPSRRSVGRWPGLRLRMLRPRLEARMQVPIALTLIAPLAAIAFTLLLCAALVAWAGAPAGRAYILLFDGAFGSRFALSETLTRATPLILTGLAAAVAFRAHFYNIGAEGQLYLGALAAVAIGGGAIHAPSLVVFPLMIAGGMLAGALLLLVPALAKARLGVDEVVTTLLLNFVALLFVSMMLDGPMKDPTSMGWPQSVPIIADLELGK